MPPLFYRLCIKLEYRLTKFFFLLCKTNKKVVLISNAKFATGATYTLLLPLVPLLPLCLCVMSFILGVWHYCSCPQSVSELLRYFTARQLFVYALFFFFSFSRRVSRSSPSAFITKVDAHTMGDNVKRFCFLQHTT